MGFIAGCSITSTSIGITAGSTVGDDNSNEGDHWGRVVKNQKVKVDAKYLIALISSGAYKYIEHMNA